MSERCDLLAECIELGHTDTIAAMGTLLVALNVRNVPRAAQVLANAPPAYACDRRPRLRALIALPVR